MRLNITPRRLQLAHSFGALFRSRPVVDPTSAGAPTPTTDSVLPEHCRLTVVGYAATACHWTIHAWLHRCSLPDGFRLSDDPQAEPVGLHLQPVDLTLAKGELNLLRQQSVVLDPSEERTCQLRDLGLNAHWLNPQGRSSGWLDETYDYAAVARQFGLPDPQWLRRKGQQLYLGSAGDEWESQLEVTSWAIPGFAALHVPDEAAARLLAGWLNACNRAGLQLIRLNPTDYEYHSQPYAALDHPDGNQVQEWVPPLMFEGPIDQEAIDAEIAWIRSGQVISPDCPTPTPEHVVLWECGHAPRGAVEPRDSRRAAVCVSLYNYRRRILSALDSVDAQTHADLELIIVDDASTDAGEQTVLQWLQTHGQRFSRASLLRHTSNAGLAAARNTAFAVAQSEWCFVLDADNLLLPDAVSHCLALADQCPGTTAVVHPLVQLRTESRLSSQSEQALLTRIPWQKQALIGGNQIDAMALIRRCHWEQVGGYSHIPYGWEDYDFWCKLIDAGLHGVLCPQVLAIYNRHVASMQATSTVRSQRFLTRLLAARYPWLRLNPRGQA